MSQGEIPTSVPSSDLGAGEPTEQSRSPDRQRIAFVGPAGAGKTTVAALVASRLAERTAVTVAGEAAAYVEQSEASPAETDSLGLHWEVVDRPSGTAALETTGETLDTAFVVATPETLDRVASYERVADRLGVETFLVVNRFEERHRDLLRKFTGLDLAEYFYEDSTVEAAMAAGTAPTLEEWTTEAILLESLQSERMALLDAMAALDSGQRAIVNVEVESEASAIDAIRSFRANGYSADFLRCNCQCHEGHVVAREQVSVHEAVRVPR
jgi:adenylate kinase family enzyme